jgi:hypothetical protein
MNEIQPRRGESFGDFHRRATERMERGPAWLQQTQSCARGEHLHETGRRTCRLCGADL